MGDTDSEAEALTDALAEPLVVTDTLAEVVADTDGDSDGLALVEAVSLTDGELLGEVDDVVVADTEGDEDGVTLSEGETEGETEEVAVTLTLRVTEGETVRLDVADCSREEGEQQADGEKGERGSYKWRDGAWATEKQQPRVLPTRCRRCSELQTPSATAASAH